MNKDLYFKNKYKKYKKKYLQLKKIFFMKGGMIIDNFPTQTEVIYSEIPENITTTTDNIVSDVPNTFK